MEIKYAGYLRVVQKSKGKFEVSLVNRPEATDGIFLAIVNTGTPAFKTLEAAIGEEIEDTFVFNYYWKGLIKIEQQGSSPLFKMLFDGNEFMKFTASGQLAENLNEFFGVTLADKVGPEYTKRNARDDARDTWQANRNRKIGTGAVEENFGKLENRILQVRGLYDVGYALKDESKPSSIARLVSMIYEQHGGFDEIKRLEVMPHAELRKTLKEYFKEIPV